MIYHQEGFLLYQQNFAVTMGERESEKGARPFIRHDFRTPSILGYI
jgi:hypothetical protein